MTSQRLSIERLLYKKSFVLHGRIGRSWDIHPLYLEKLYWSRYEVWLREAEFERLILAANGYEPQRAWALRLGRSIVRMGQRFERFGQPGIDSHRQLRHSGKY